MSREWADEQEDIQPRPELEPFYVLAAMQFGDPELGIERFAAEFHKLYASYAGHIVPYPENGRVLLQYIIWYDRHKPT